MTAFETATMRAISETDKSPTREQAEEAIRTLIRWIGDDPNREGLIETPARVVKSYEEFYSGYKKDAKIILEKTFKDTSDYSDQIILKNIAFHSHCEHHMAPIIGKASIGYIPDNCVVGISKLARILDMYSKRLQTQETMTADIANSIQSNLKPLGVAVFISANHHCMSTRGVHKENVDMITTHFTGKFRDNFDLKERFLSSIENT